MAQQRGLAGGADAGEGVKLGGLQAAAAQLAVVGDGEAVGLLLHLADEGEEGRDGGDAGLPAVGR